MNRRLVLYALPFVIVAVAAIAYITLNNGSGVDLSNTFDESTAFEVRYPESWAYQIPAANVFVLAPPVLLNEGEEGPSITIQRATPFEAGGDALDIILQTYLERNNLIGDTAEGWEQLNDFSETEIGGRPALSVELRGSITPQDTLNHTKIIVAQSENEDMVYFFFASAPDSLWSEFDDTLDAILDSVLIKE